MYLGSPYKNSLGTARRLGAFLAFAVRSTMISMRSSHDLVYASSTPLSVALPALIAKTFRGTPYVFEVRDVWPLVPVQMNFIRNPLLVGFANVLEKMAYDSAEVVVALSPLMAKDVNRRTKTPVVVIPNGSDVDRFRMPPSTREQFRNQLGWTKPTITYAGSFGRIYNPTWMVKFAHALHARNISFIGYGDGVLLDTCRRQAAELGLAPTQVFPGPISKDRVAEALSASDIAFSSVENHSALLPASINKIFDAFAAGVPVAANHDGWLTELLQSKRAGLRVSSDPERAAEEVASLLDSPQLLREMRENSALLGDTVFNRDAQYQQLAEVIGGAIGGKDAHG